MESYYIQKDSKVDNKTLEINTDGELQIKYSSLSKGVVFDESNIIKQNTNELSLPYSENYIQRCQITIDSNVGIIDLLKLAITAKVASHYHGASMDIRVNGVSVKVLGCSVETWLTQSFNLENLQGGDIISFWGKCGGSGGGIMKDITIYGKEEGVIYLPTSENLGEFE